MNGLGVGFKRGVGWLVGAKSSSAAVAHTLTARVGITAINFFTGILVARTLEAHGRGVQAAVSIWPIVLSGVFTLGIPTALRFFVPQNPDKAGRLFTAGLVYAVALGVLAIAAGLLFIPYWLAKYGADDIRFAELMMLFAPGFLVMLYVQAFLEAMGRFARSNAATYVPALATLATLAVLAATHRLTPYSSSLAYLAPTSVFAIVRIIELRAYVAAPIAAVRDKWRDLLGYGIKASAIDILTTLSLQIDQALVIRFLSASQLGTYTVALAVSRLLNIFAQSLNSVLLPKAAALERAQAIALVAIVARVTLAMTAAAAAVCAIVIPFVIPFFYGHAFDGSVRLAQILLAEVTIAATVNVLAQSFLSTGRPGVVAALQGVGLAATVPFMIIAIPRFGLTGAALALLASTCLRLVFVMLCFPSLLRVAPPSLILKSRDISFIRARLSQRSHAAATR